MPIIPLMKTKYLIILMVTVTVLSFLGCEILPEVRYKPTLLNPFPMLRSVAVVPFYNETNNPAVNGREVADCFANELQRVEGFHVIANRRVEEVMLAEGLTELQSVNEIRYLAQILEVDVVVIGKIHHYYDYYPRSIKFETEWYSVNPYHHPIVPGRGLPWGTKYEGDIPMKTVREAEMTLAAAQLRTQEPDYEPVTKKQLEQERRDRLNPKTTEDGTDKQDLPTTQRPSRQPQREARNSNPIRPAAYSGPPYRGDSSDNMQARYVEKVQDDFINAHLTMTGVTLPDEMTIYREQNQQQEAALYDPELPHPLHDGPLPTPWSKQNQEPLALRQNGDAGGFQGQYPGFPQPMYLTPEEILQYGMVDQQVPAPPNYGAMMPGTPVAGRPGMIYGEPDRFPGLPIDWPDPRGFTPEGPRAEKEQPTVKSDAPVMNHISFYEGNDSEFTQALDDYDFLFRDDKRIIGSKTILNNRVEFLRFCCRMHIWEMFGSRGGIDQSEKVVRQKKFWIGGGQ